MDDVILLTVARTPDDTRDQLRTLASIRLPGYDKERTERLAGIRAALKWSIAERDVTPLSGTTRSATPKAVAGQLQVADVLAGTASAVRPYARGVRAGLLWLLGENDALDEIGFGPRP